MCCKDKFIPASAFPSLTPVDLLLPPYAIAIAARPSRILRIIVMDCMHRVRLGLGLGGACVWWVSSEEVHSHQKLHLSLSTHRLPPPLAPSRGAVRVTVHTDAGLRTLRLRAERGWEVLVKRAHGVCLRTRPLPLCFFPPFACVHTGAVSYSASSSTQMEGRCQLVWRGPRTRATAIARTRFVNAHALPHASQHACRPYRHSRAVCAAGGLDWWTHRAQSTSSALVHVHFTP